jgi:hypothetical protein
VIGLGGLFAGVTGPLLSTFVPPLVRGALGEHRTAIGLVMAIDNVVFDLFGGYRPMFLMMAIYTILGLVAVLFVPRGTGEAQRA